MDVTKKNRGAPPDLELRGSCRATTPGYRPCVMSLTVLARFIAQGGGITLMLGRAT
jgi:hypothetical protein